MKLKYLLIILLFFRFILFAQSNDAPAPSIFIGYNYSLSNASGLTLSGQLHFTKQIPGSINNYHWQVFNPSITADIEIFNLFNLTCDINYDLLLVTCDIGNFNLNRHEILFTTNLFKKFTLHNYFLGIGTGCNNRFFLTQNMNGINKEMDVIVYDPIEMNTVQIGTQKIPFEKYLIYLSIDAFNGIEINRFKPYIDYRFTLHKYGFYSQMSAGTNASFYKNRITLLLSDIVKFYHPEIKNYIHISIGYSWFRSKKE